MKTKQKWLKIHFLYYFFLLNSTDLLAIPACEGFNAPKMDAYECDLTAPKTKFRVEWDSNLCRNRSWLHSSDSRHTVTPSSPLTFASSRAGAQDYKKGKVIVKDSKSETSRYAYLDFSTKAMVTSPVAWVSGIYRDGAVDIFNTDETRVYPSDIHRDGENVNHFSIDEDGKFRRFVIVMGQFYETTGNCKLIRLR